MNENVILFEKIRKRIYPQKNADDIICELTFEVCRLYSGCKCGCKCVGDILDNHIKEFIPMFNARIPFDIYNKKSSQEELTKTIVKYPDLIAKGIGLKYTHIKKPAHITDLIFTLKFQNITIQIPKNHIFRSGLFLNLLLDNIISEEFDMPLSPQKML